MDERKRALVVGINAYGAGVPSLGSAVRDAEAIAQQLELAHGYEVELLRDAEATVGSIMASLAGVVDAGLSEESSFVLYYAGHGIAADDIDGAGPQGFLLAHDAELTNQGTWLGMSSLRDALDGLSCRHLMMVLDCCYAGAFRWASTRSVGVAKRPLYKSQYERYREGIAWQVLTSASYDEEADDAAPVTPDRGDRAGPGGHSPFAQALITALSGSDADSSRGGMAADGVITATELYQFIYEQVAVNDRQTPGIFPLKHDNKGEFVFLAPGVELNLEPDPPLDDATNPWLGLDPYTSADRDLFFGRDEATKGLVERVKADRFVAVVGPSGSGKSSLIHAGLLPALEAADQDWAVIESTRLTADPAAQLEAARMQLTSAAASERQLLVIDQFENLFRSAGDTDRTRFLGDLRAMVESIDGPTVVIGLRTNFENRAATELGDLWTDEARVPVPEFSPDELRSVILGPAQAKAVFFEPASIIDDLVHEVVRMPGAGPLLSLTLAALYRQAQARRHDTGTADRMLSAEDYDAIGGVAGVVHRRAHDLYNRADDAGKSTIRRLLLRLVEQGTDGLKRRRVDREELRFGEGHEQIVASTLDSLVAGGLLVVGSDSEREYVEAAHDALVTSWDKQLEWLAQSGSQKVIRDAWGAADDWRRTDACRATSKYLWNHNPNLLELERRDREQELNALEQDFRSASTVRKTRLARRLVIVTAAVIVALSVAGAAFYLQRNEARQQARVSTSRQLAAIGLELAGGGSHDQALLIAAEGFRIGDGQVPRDPPTLLNRSTGQSLDALLGAVAQWPALTQVLTGHEDAVRAAAISGDGRVAATADAGGLIALWDTATGELRGSFQLDDAIPAGSVSSEQSRSLALDDDGSVVAVITGAKGDAVWVWEAQSGAHKMTVDAADLAPSEFETRAFENISVSADGTRLLSSQLAGATVWETETGERLEELSVDEEPYVKQSLLGPSAQLALIGGESAQHLISVDDPESILVSVENAARFGAAFSSDGCTVAIVGRRAIEGIGVQEGIWFFDLGSLAFWPDPIPLDEPASFLAFSPDGQRLTASVGPSGGPQMLTVWGLPKAAAPQGDAANPCPIAEPYAPFDIEAETPVRAVAGAAFTKDGAVVAVAPTQHGAFVWDASADPAAGDVYEGDAIALSGDGRTVVFAAPNEESPEARIVDLETGASSSIPVTTNEYGRQPAMAVNDGGSLIATFVDELVVLWAIDPNTGRGTSSVLGPGDSQDDMVDEYPISFDPTGRWLAWVSGESIVIWDIGRDIELRRLDIGFEFVP